MRLLGGVHLDSLTTSDQECPLEEQLISVLNLFETEVFSDCLDGGYTPLKRGRSASQRDL